MMDQLSDINVLSGSQTTVGLRIGNNIDTITDIRESMGTLLGHGILTTLSWILGHANISGNEIADQLAKNAAKVVSSQNDIAMVDVRSAVKMSTKLNMAS
ncbi:Hypothetical predicted protein [Mytilus galloprovincialis]|uniref:RNase H type-1 domain-containing protein n=1 Tax=Mytilus galloprovincialis TaxID=29158 RepID=A0A8B6BHL2_MYTGA|nr:Hypothetical predicted protein [Mytilus galloprovincialis]